jgi:hypothetical protein
VKRLIVVGVLLVGLACLVYARPGPDSNYNLSVGSPSYTGPGDLSLSGVLAWWGMRAYSLAKTGTKIANICNAGDANCADINSLANGNFDVTTAQAAPLNCGTCTIKVLYDQSGANSCSAAACDLTQATEASRPKLTFNCLNTSLVCADFTSSGTLGIRNTTGFGAVSQPFSVSVVWNRTTNNSAYENILVTNATQQGVIGNNAANGVAMYEGSSVPAATANDNALHAGNFRFDNTTGWANVDGTKTTMNLGTASSQPAGALALGNNTNQATPLMKFAEGGWWSTPFSDPPTSLCHNQFTYWNTATSC